MRFSRGAAALALSGVLVSAPSFGDEYYTVDIGSEVTRGDYGTSEISTVWSIPIGLRYQGERLSWSLTIPYLVVEAPPEFVVMGGGGGGGGMVGPGDSTTGGGGPGTGSGGTTVSATRTVSGLGDLTAGMGWLIAGGGTDEPWLGVNGEVKFATADEKENLGTGENDYALQLAAGNAWLNGRVGYRWLGDTAVTDYENPVYAALGFSYAGKEGGSVGLEWYGEQAIVSGGDERQELTLYGAYPFDDELRIQGYLFKGFTDASADYGAGIHLLVGL